MECTKNSFFLSSLAPFLLAVTQEYKTILIGKLLLEAVMLDFCWESLHFWHGWSDYGCLNDSVIRLLIKLPNF